MIIENVDWCNECFESNTLIIGPQNKIKVIRYKSFSNQPQL